jgi:hypothetical protein
VHAPQTKGAEAERDHGAQVVRWITASNTTARRLDDRAPAL